MQNSNLSVNSKTILVGTSHPTLMLNNKQITIYDEIDIFANAFTDYLVIHHNNLQTSNVRLQTWVGYDMDRHPHERTGIFSYTFLKHIQATLNAYKKLDKNIDCQDQIDTINAILKSMKIKFNAGQGISQMSLSLYLQEVSNKIKDEFLMLSIQNNAKTHDAFLIYNIFGPQGQYRVSSTDLHNENGKKKIKQRLKELKIIEEYFGVIAVSEIIIADCQSNKDIVILRELINEIFNVFKYPPLPITPLIEESISKDEILNLLQYSTKIMVAGSDTVQRETFTGAILLKLHIQLLIEQVNQHLGNQNDNENKITFFEGVGSTIARSSMDSMATVFATTKHERTIQGQQYYKFLTDKKYHDHFISSILNLPRCNIAQNQINIAINILQSVFQNVSVNQIEFQKEPQYTQNFDADKITQLNNNHIPYCGSRAKFLENIIIKNARAITQSFIHENIGFQPEMLFWQNLSPNILQDIKNNLHNPIIKTFVKHYAEIYKMCDIEKTSQFITNKSTLKQFIEGLNSFKNILNELNIDSENLNRHSRSKSLTTTHEHNQPKFSLPHLSQSEQKTLHAIYRQDANGLKKHNPHINLLLQNTEYFVKGIG